MKHIPQNATNLNQALEIASVKTSVSKNEWIKNGKTIDMIRQKTLLDYF
jgi:hypothetical protein